VSDAYEAFADAYAAHTATGAWNALYERPAVLELLGDVRGRTVLDAGCGPGHLAGALAGRGARVIGCDASPRMVELTRAALGPGADVRVHDLGTPLAWLGDGAVDAAVLALALHYVDDRVALLAELRRVLRPGGALVVSTHHPTADWLRLGGSYFEVGVVEESLRAGADWPVRYWRRPLGVLCDEARDAGLVLDRLVEPAPRPEMAASHPEIHARLTAAPGFLLLRLLAP
jgi:SAM-dependent methyltransferase